MNEWFKDLLSTVPDAIASPFTQWHQDEIDKEITLETNYQLHEERMKKLEIDHQERMMQKVLVAEYLKTLQIAMETGHMDRELGEGLQRLPRLLG